MKYKVIVIPVIAAFAVFIISYTTMRNSNFEKPALLVEKEKKVVKPAKTKKKKPKIKPAPVRKPKAEALPEKENEAVEGSSPQNLAIMNIVAKKINSYALQNNLSTEYCFLVDMSLPSGRNRFFAYDLTKKAIIFSALVAHGSCNETFLSRPRFSNEAKSGCSSLGKYTVGEFYTGKYGKSYRLHGLDNCNSNAYKRAVVIHGFSCVPDEEIYPRVLCNSLGCVMVSYRSFDKISRLIRKTDKPIMLWIYQ